MCCWNLSEEMQTCSVRTGIAEGVNQVCCVLVNDLAIDSKSSLSLPFELTFAVSLLSFRPSLGPFTRGI